MSPSTAKAGLKRKLPAHAGDQERATEAPPTVPGRATAPSPAPDGITQQKRPRVDASNKYPFHKSKEDHGPRPGHTSQSQHPHGRPRDIPSGAETPRRSTSLNSTKARQVLQPIPPRYKLTQPARQPVKKPPVTTLPRWTTTAIVDASSMPAHVIKANDKSDKPKGDWRRGAAVMRTSSCEYQSTVLQRRMGPQYNPYSSGSSASSYGSRVTESDYDSPPRRSKPSRQTRVPPQQYATQSRVAPPKSSSANARKPAVINPVPKKITPPKSGLFSILGEINREKAGGIREKPLPQQPTKQSTAKTSQQMSVQSAQKSVEKPAPKAVKPIEKVAPKVVKPVQKAAQPVQKSSQQYTQQPAKKGMDQSVQTSINLPVKKVVQQVAPKIAEQPPQKAVQQPAPKVAQKPAQKPAQEAPEKPAQQTVQPVKRKRSESTSLDAEEQQSKKQRASPPPLSPPTDISITPTVAETNNAQPPRKKMSLAEYSRRRKAA